MGQVFPIPVKDGRWNMSGRGGFQPLKLLFVSLDDPYNFRVHPVQFVVFLGERHGHPCGDRLVLAKLSRLSHVAIAFRIHRLRGGRHVDPGRTILVEGELDLEPFRSDHGHFQTPEAAFTEVLEASLQSGRVQLLGQRIVTQAFQILE